jgi:NAD(P)H-dependent FMN reductase
MLAGKRVRGKKTQCAGLTSSEFPGKASEEARDLAAAAKAADGVRTTPDIFGAIPSPVKNVPDELLAPAPRQGEWYQFCDTSMRGHANK